MDNCLRGDVGARTRPIFDNELLTESIRQPLAISLAVMSDEVPAGNPTIKCTGRPG